MGYQPLGQFGGSLRDPFRTEFQHLRGGVLTARELVVAGGTQGVIRSQNYDPTNELGWAIFGDGSSSFYGDVTIGANAIILGDVYSGNWDGTIPANLASRDTGATAGYYLDASVGAAQFEGSMFIDGSLEVRGTTSLYSTLSVETGGSITVDGTSGQKTVLTYIGGLGGVQFHGATGEDQYGYIYAINSEELQIAAPIGNDATYSGGIMRIQSANALGFEAGFIFGETGASTNNWVTINADGIGIDNTVTLTTGSNSLRNETQHGYIEFGPQNTGYAHVKTDRSQFYFDKEIQIDGSPNRIRSYDGYWYLDDDGLRINGQNPYTTQAAHLILQSSSFGDAFDDQTAIIHLGESDFGGSAALKIVYHGNGYSYIGMGTTSLGNNPYMSLPGIRLHYNTDEVVLAAADTYIHELFDDIGNHEVLRADRSVTGTYTKVGYYSSWVVDPETGRRRKADIARLADNPADWWDRSWFMDLEPIKYRRTNEALKPAPSKAKKPGVKVSGRKWPRPQIEFGFSIENLTQHTKYLTTGGDRIGSSPDEYALLAVTVDYVQHLEERVAALEEKIAALT